MNDNMMKNEVKYLREHLLEIYQYKSSMADLTYDMPLELITRCCIAFDYLQQELQRKDNIINEYENKGYDIATERADFLLKIQDLQQELQRKNNNWNELKRYIKASDDCWDLQAVLDKIKEIESK